MAAASSIFGRFLAYFTVVLLFAAAGPIITKPASTPPPAAAVVETLDNATCLTCHDGNKGKLELVADGKTRELRALAADKYSRSVHAKMQCIDCHTDIGDNARIGNAHQRNAEKTPAKADCAACHRDLWATAQQNQQTKEKERLGVVVANIDAYRKSLHARPNADDPSHPNASCDNCHDTHSFDLPAKASPQHAAMRLEIPQTCGKNCHEEALEAYSESIHGKELSEKHNAKSAVCSDCHSTHAVGNTSLAPIKLAITAKCGSCHDDNYKTYKGTYHGQISTLGYAYTAKCYDCHGSHGILSVKDPKSKVHPDNRMKTCKECHSPQKGRAEAPPAFATFEPHGHGGDFERYPAIWIASQLMIQLLVGTFAFFWLHTLLWFYREYKELRKSRNQPHVKVDRRLTEVPARLKGKYHQRFSRTWRIAHFTFAVSLMILTLTGFPLFYPDAPWAAGLMAALGGPQIAGTIHRVNAVIFSGVFFWHLAYMGVKLARNWSRFKIFGPDSLMPNLKDLQDMIAMFKWFIGKGYRPQFDRWTYWEKFDYWAPFWGVTIVGVSGLMMWLPKITGAYLPGWAFNVAAIFHGEEAFLAVVFLFTVHFFNNHFRPDKFPLEVVMFTGSMTLEHFKREHPLQYQRLVDTGKLEEHLVEPPTPTLAKASKILGFTLIAIGLSLLTLVAIGFFGEIRTMM